MAKQTLDLGVEGMSCQHCVHAVKSAVAVLAVLLNPSLRAARDARGVAAAQVLQAGIGNRGAAQVKSLEADHLLHVLQARVGNAGYGRG